MRRALILSAEKSSVRKSQTYNWQGPLSAASICVLGSLATGQSVTRNLYRAGARKISLVNVDLLDSDIDIDYSTAAKSEFCQTIDAEWTIANIEGFVQEAEIVIDTLSDWQQKLTLSDICMDREKVLVHSGITGFRFQIYTMIPGRSACLRCALPLAGIDQVPLGPTGPPAIDAVIELVDAWQSLEAIKYLAKIGIVQGNELFKFDCLSGEFEVIRGLDAKLDCPDCGRKIGKLKRPS
jgi:molybdopterin-synthase adenylyltransferase